MGQISFPPFDECVELYTEDVSAASPLSYRVKVPSNPLVEANAVSISEWIDKEIQVPKLNQIHSSLWWAGRPGNIRPLHRQLMMHREVLITEDPALHLVWYEKTMYIKPLPEFLLCWQFYQDHICPDPSRAALAAGFLSTYLLLIPRRSDFRIAVKLGLLPDGLVWEQWRAFAASLHENLKHVLLNKRYHYGELRLRRLNHIYLLSRLGLMYYSTYSQYDHFFSQNFAWCVLAFGFFTVILDAMQVVLSTSETPAAFDGAAYRFGVFAVVVVVCAATLITALFLGLFVYFLAITLRTKAADNREGDPRRERVTSGCSV